MAGTGTSNNLSTVLDDSDGRALVREYLDKTWLERVNFESPLANTAWGMVKGIPNNEGQYITMSRKNHLRRPETMATPGGRGSDPASGALLGTEKVVVPIEFIHEYLPIGTVANMTSWADLEEWAEEDMPIALKRRAHELVQNAFISGRKTPGVYDSSGDQTTVFDQAAQATVTLYGLSFTFQAAPHFYAGGHDTWALLAAGSGKTAMSDLDDIALGLKLAGAPTINGKLICSLSASMMTDMLSDAGLPEIVKKSIEGGSKVLIDGVERKFLGSFGNLHYVEDPEPFTEDPGGTESYRAEWGSIHSAMIFGAKSFGFFPLGKKQSKKWKPQFKVQDITKTGYEKTIGYLTPFQTAIVNPNWVAVYKAHVTKSKPNNYGASNKQLHGFELS